MHEQNRTGEGGCAGCAGRLEFDFTFAFQPIVDIGSGEIWSYEALIRGPDGESAGQVLSQVHDGNRYRFDQACRVRAIEVASRLGLQQRLNINFLPNAVYRPELCILTTLEAARTYDFPVSRLVFEVTEGEQIEDKAHLASIIREYKRLGFATAIDDFGAGYSGLNLLIEYQPDHIKLDRQLVMHIDTDPKRRAIVSGIQQVCGQLDISLIAEGVETREEFLTLRDMGLHLFQGFYFARPAFEQLPPVPAECMAG